MEDGRKGMQMPREIENMKKKIHAKARKMLQHGIGNFVWTSGSGRREVCGSRKKFAEKRESKRTSETPQSRGSAELGKVVTGSATQGLCLKDREVRSQVIGEDRN